MESMDVVHFQLLSMGAVVLFEAVGGFLPLLFRDTEKYGRTISRANTLSGGFFLGGAMFHMLPESVEMIGEHIEGVPEEFPLAYVIAVCGFLCVLILEKVALTKNILGDSHSKKVDTEKEIEMVVADLESSITGKVDDNLSLIAGDHMMPYASFETPRERRSPMKILGVVNAPTTPPRSFSPGTTRSRTPSKNGYHKGRKTAATSPLKDTSVGDNYLYPSARCHTESPLSTMSGGHGHNHHHLLNEPSSLLPYLVAMTLSFHSFVAGLAMGTEAEMTEAVAIIIAILAHKWAEAMALGITLVKAKAPMRHYLKLFLSYAIMTPLGIGCGMLLEHVESRHVADIAASIVQAVAAGTFLYVAILDVLAVEFSDPRDKWVKTGLTITGLTGMAVLALWA